MKPTQLIRVAFGYLFFFSLQIGAWALFAPQSFYDNFPGAGRSWVAIDGPYNEHLLRDVGALNLAFAVLVLWAAVTLSPPLVTAVAVAAMVWGVPHLLYHLFNTDGLSNGDLAGSFGGLVLFAALPSVVLWAVRALADEEPPVQAPAVAHGSSQA